MKSSDIIPLERIVAVEDALIQTFGTTEVTATSVLAGGLSAAQTFKFTLNNRAYVLKLSPPGFDTSNLSLAAAAGIAPPLHYHDIRIGIYISDHIINQPLRSAIPPDKLIPELATKVKTIHAIPSGTNGTPLFETVDTMINQFKQSVIMAGPVFDECFANYEELKNKLSLGEADKVFSHNDLNPNNILCDVEQIWIIDWDTAHLNDRYIDLANLANFFVHTEEQEQVYLDTYFDGNIDEYKKARFFTMRQVCRIVYAMLMFQLAARHKPADHQHDQQMEGVDLNGFFILMGKGEISLATYDGQLMYGKALLNTAVHQMRSDRWQYSLNQFI